MKPSAGNTSRNGDVKRRPSTPRGAFLLRFGVAHFLSYPPAFAAAFAGVPLAMILREQAVLSAGSEEVAQRLVLEVCIAAGALVYLLIHLYSLPWSLAAAALLRGDTHASERCRRGRTFFIAATLVTVFVSVTGALVGWTWLLV